MTDTIYMQPIGSGHIKALGHNDGNLYVEFKNGDRYEYTDVPHKLYEDGLKSASAGKWLHSEIKGKFKHRKL